MARYVACACLCCVLFRLSAPVAWAEERPRAEAAADAWAAQQRMEASFDNGYWAGAGLNLTIYGSLITAGSLPILFLGLQAGDDALGLGSAVQAVGWTILAVGLGQLITGAMWVQGSYVMSNDMAEQERLKLAYDAGYMDGLGWTFEGYGGVLLLLGGLLLGSDGDAQTTGAAVVGVGVLNAGLGLYCLISDPQREDVMRQVGAVALPVWRVTF